jgi:hypothetical protein
MRFFGGKRQFTRPHQNGALGRTIGKTAGFDNKFFCYFWIIFPIFTQVVYIEALATCQNRHFCFSKQGGLSPKTASSLFLYAPQPDIPQDVSSSAAPPVHCVLNQISTAHPVPKNQAKACTAK